MLDLADVRINRKEIIWNYFPKEEWDRFHSVLDCGSSNGAKGMQYYIKQGLNPGRVHAVDFDHAGLQVLEKLGVHTHYENLEYRKPSAFLPSVFDLILCVEMLEHVTQECHDLLLNSFMHILRPGGHIVLTFPVNAFAKTNKAHIRQPKCGPILKKLASLFQNVEMRKYGKRTYMLFFMGKL